MKNILQLKGYGEILQYQDLISLGQGSPGETIEAYSKYQAISIDLRMKLNQVPTTLLDGLKLAKTIDQELDLETQLWLIGYLQQKDWQRSYNPARVAALEEARRYLLAYVQPRLVWENLYFKLFLS
jgi:DNA polymerase-3 subunit delta'